MFQLVNQNTIFDLINETRIEIYLQKDKTRYDVIRFLDDVSIWMDKNRDYIAKEYLPFGVLSVGSTPIQISAFLYGVFVGKSLEKARLKTKFIIKKVNKKEILKEIENNIDNYNELTEDKNETDR